MRGTGIWAAAVKVSGSGKATASGAETAYAAASIAASSATIYPIGDYRKFYVREARAKIRSSTPSLSRLSEISLLSDGELLKNVRQMRVTEKKIEISMLLYLIEVERRGLDLSGGYNSLFAFCTKHLKYSDSVAGRRIRAARCMREFPAVYEYLSAGKVNVCNISEAAKIMTEKNHLSLLGQISGRSTSYVRVLVSGQQPATFIRDRVTPVKVFEKVSVKESGDSNRKTTEVNPGGGKKLITTSGDKESCTLFGLSTDGGSKGEGEEGAAPALKDRGPLEGSIRVREIQKFKLQFAVSPEFMKKYERIKVLMSTKHPGGLDFEGAFESLMDEYIERHSPEAREKRREARAVKAAKVKKVESSMKADRATKVKSVVEVAKVKPAAKVERVAKKVKKTEEKTETSPASPAAPAKGPEGPLASPESSRFIPQAIKDKVFKRDGGKCSFTGPGGQRCDSKWNLQVHHITPFALGGSNSPENLQLLCRRHNQHKAVKDFGKKKIDGHLKKEHSKRG